MIKRLFRCYCQEDQGQGLTEYALFLVLVALVAAIASARALSNSRDRTGRVPHAAALNTQERCTVVTREAITEGFSLGSRATAGDYKSATMPSPQGNER
jgi:Flp pilus assembly pilin Flp